MKHSTRTFAVVAAIALVVFAAACGNTTSPASSDEPGLPSPTPTFRLGVVPGNSLMAPLPTDAPAAVISRASLPSCGAVYLFEEDVDISPIPTSPFATTGPTEKQQAVDCLISAWTNGRPAEMVTNEVSDEADEIYSIYRLPGDHTVEVIVRVLSHTDKAVSWTRAICHQLSAQAASVTPASCAPETPIG